MGSNNTNKFNPQERMKMHPYQRVSSNNTNKFNPQEHKPSKLIFIKSSNNTNKFNPQELSVTALVLTIVQIIQINSILKNLLQFY